LFTTLYICTTSAEQLLDAWPNSCFAAFPGAAAAFSLLFALAGVSASSAALPRALRLGVEGVFMTLDSSAAAGSPEASSARSCFRALLFAA
jgi:hypothetical protein